MSEVRVRFCPSPTGTPHVGNIRTALFNWAWAKHTKGKFIFRIEDTDTQRDSEESYQLLLEALRWLNIDWDEGVEVGGPDEPYRQSQRYNIYKQVVKKLLTTGLAYESFSTPEEIQQRNINNGRPAQFGYDGADRHTSQADKQSFIDQGRKPVIRIKMPDCDITFTDLIRGTITFPAGSVPDYVIVRGNGHPLYTLVNPVDDALMGINCVLRGEDILSSTPRQIVLYKYLKDIGINKNQGDGVPQFGHLPYVMGEGNKKLSKRDPSSNLFLYKDEGFLPEAFINYLALLGWAIAPDRDIFSTKDFIKNFDIKAVNPNAARFDYKKALAINSEHIRSLPCEKLINYIVPYMHRDKILSAKQFANLNDREKNILKLATPLIQPRIQTLNQASSMLRFLFIKADNLEINQEAREQLNQTDKKVPHKQVLQISRDILTKENNWQTDILHTILFKQLIEVNNYKPKIAFTPLRVAISGKRVSPPLFESMAILGKNETIKRIEKLL
ncbi:MAG: glutamate--tRNA ligase [Bifidobacteriaceae bacterium]|jgi:glutamyl-tRNA synthetase|nr:glutamate--tRNA ligase [Bifidobacteriaceae bacterium]